METVTTILARLGFGHPLIRALSGFLIASVTSFYFKPSLSFTEEGKPKKWLSETHFPWFIVGILGGLIFSAF